MKGEICGESGTHALLEHYLVQQVGCYDYQIGFYEVEYLGIHFSFPFFIRVTISSSSSGVMLFFAGKESDHLLIRVAEIILHDVAEASPLEFAAVNGRSI